MPEKMSKADEVLAKYEEAKSSFNILFDEMEEDFEFYNSKQWADTDIERAKRLKAPTLNLNYIKKTVDVLSGFQRQNETDVKAFPIESDDEKHSEVYSRLIKWITATNESNHYVSQAFKDALIGGVGWLAPEVDFDHDIINGDIKVGKVDPFNILLDPYFKSQDLSDCEYLIRHKKISKGKLKRLFPDKSNVIDRVVSKYTDNDGMREEVEAPDDLGNQILTIEYWYRQYVNKTFLVNNENPMEMEEFNGNNDELQEILAGGTVTPVKRRVAAIKLRIVAGNEVLFDGDNPFGTKSFPFIPIFAYFNTGSMDWQYRLSGVVRHMKDPQREKNKRRSVIMQVLGKMPQYGWIMDEGAVDDENALKRGDNIIKKRPGLQLEKIKPSEIPASIMTLEQQFDQDLRMIGANTDMLGQQAERAEAGIVVRSRIKQGLMGSQEIFDNLGFAKRQLGRYLIEIINQNYTKDKIERIVGSDLEFVPEELEQQVQQLAEQASQAADQLEEEKEKMQEDLENMEAEGQELDEEAQQQVVQQLDAMEQQVQQMQQQAEQAQAQLAMAKADEQIFWQTFEKMRYNTRFDVAIDETGTNVTFRQAALQDLLQAAQYQIPIPPQSIVELLEIPVENKKQIAQYIQQQQEAAAQQAQLEAQKEQNKVELEKMKIEGQMQVELIKQNINPQTGERMPEPEKSETK